MLSIVNYANYVMGTPPVMPPITSDAPRHVASASTMAGAMLEICEKLQIILLGFGYLESSEKSKNTQILHI